MALDHESWKLIQRQTRGKIDVSQARLKVGDTACWSDVKKVGSKLATVGGRVFRIYV